MFHSSSVTLLLSKVRPLVKGLIHKISCPSLPIGGAVHPVLHFLSMLSCRWWLVIGRETDGANFKMASAQAGFTPSLCLTVNQAVLCCAVQTKDHQ